MLRMRATAPRELSAIANAGKEIASWPVSRVLSGGLPLRNGHSSGTPIAKRLKQPTRVAGLKTRPGATLSRAPGHPYLVLLPVGFALPRPSPAARCALTAPFHPYLAENRRPTPRHEPDAVRPVTNPVSTCH